MWYTCHIFDGDFPHHFTPTHRITLWLLAPLAVMLLQSAPCVAVAVADDEREVGGMDGENRRGWICSA